MHAAEKLKRMAREIIGGTGAGFVVFFFFAAVFCSFFFFPTTSYYIRHPSQEAG